MVDFCFFIIIWYTEELQVHPMKLIMYITAAESVTLLMSSISYRTCTLNLPEIFSYTVYWSSDYFTKFRALNCLKFFTRNILVFSVVCAMWLNFFLCVDLILMIRKPFQQKEGLMWKYLTYTLALSLFSTSLANPGWEGYSIINVEVLDIA